MGNPSLSRSCTKAENHTESRWSMSTRGIYVWICGLILRIKVWLEILSSTNRWTAAKIYRHASNWATVLVSLSSRLENTLSSLSGPVKVGLPSHHCAPDNDQRLLEYIPGTQDMDWGGNYSRRFKLQREYCLWIYKGLSTSNSVTSSYEPRFVPQRVSLPHTLLSLLCSLTDMFIILYRLLIWLVYLVWSPFQKISESCIRTVVWLDYWMFLGSMWSRCLLQMLDQLVFALQSSFCRKTLFRLKDVLVHSIWLCGLDVHTSCAILSESIFHCLCLPTLTHNELEVIYCRCIQHSTIFFNTSAEKDNSCTVFCPGLISGHYFHHTWLNNVFDQGLFKRKMNLGKIRALPVTKLLA